MLLVVVSHCVPLILALEFVFEDIFANINRIFDEVCFSMGTDKPAGSHCKDMFGLLY